MSKNQTVRRPEVTATSLIRNYQSEVERQKNLIRRANMLEEKLLFLTSALSRLAEDDQFIAILKAANMDSMPKYLADRIQTKGL